jgi:hypothetical protein
MYRSSQTKDKELRDSAALLKTRYRPKRKRMRPWPMSPNMTPKKKGKVTVVNMAGLISEYLGTP